MNLRSIDLNLLVILDALLSERSVTRAARRLFLSQPAASNALGRLRQLFKDPLLVRGASGMELTPRAMVLSKPVADALRKMSEALDARSRFDPRTADLSVHLAMTEYVAYVLLPPLLGRLRTTAPNVRIMMSDVDKRDPLGQLHSGKVDLVCAYIPDPPLDLHCRELFRDRWVCIARKGHADIDGRLTLRRFGALAHVVVPMQTGGFASHIGNILAGRGLTRRIALSAPHFLALPAIISHSDLVMTTTQRIGAAFARHYPLKVFPHPLKLPAFGISAFWHDRTDGDPGHRWFRDMLAEVGSRSGGRPTAK